MAKTQTLSNTEMAVMNLEVDIAQRKFSFFDQGFVEGEGIWYSCLRDEQKVSPKLAARAITALLKLGYFVRDLKDEDGEQWMGLTEEGVAHYTKLAEVFAGETHRFEIVEEEADTKAPKTPRKPSNTKKATTPCKCGCGAQNSSTYLPGHDAKHVSFFRHDVAECKTDKEYEEVLAQAAKTLSPRLLAKFLGTQNTAK